jgi:hypothetical protein
MLKRVPQLLLILVFSGLPFSLLIAQLSDPQSIQAMVSRFKKDPRGPYADIRWFCEDGSIRAAKDPCPDKTGHQHARNKDEVNALAKKEHIFLGQILANTSYPDFWDNDKAHSRLKQYQLEQYLRAIDNGWINQRAQYYRGAVQVEDENNWGIGFYQWLLKDTTAIASQYFLIRQSAKDIPHLADNNTAQLVRAISKEIADTFPSFQDLRIKIHGSPDKGDIQLVREFQKKNQDNIPVYLKPKFDQLISELTTLYRPFQVSDLDELRKKLPWDSNVAISLKVFTEKYPSLATPGERCQFISSVALMLPQQIKESMSADARLAILDISIKMENLLNNEATQWQVSSLNELLAQVYCYTTAAAAFGYLERWEWEQLRDLLQVPTENKITLQSLNDYSEGGRHAVEWAAGMVRTHYMPVINLYRDFEPLASGFYDDRIRSSILLHLGQAVSRLGDAFSSEAGFSNAVLSIPDQSSIHGLNPGFTVGELVVVNESPDNIDLSPDKIYVFHQPPKDLKPVAGIITVSEGNTVSHIQLLARNLGIPNAVISEANMEAMKAFNGTKVFYAVSNKATVIIKPATEMDASEVELFKQKKRKEEKISVPIERIELDNPHVLNLNQVNASQSGKTCGPKAANLGQLKQMFPENVVDGLVLPFAIFRQHMDQTIPGYSTTYWEMMNGIFDAGEAMRAAGDSTTRVEAFILHGLDSLRMLIKKMPFLPAFQNELQLQFQVILGQPMGKVPVFIRSDTNMEDLKDFTGAGLNLTVFNVVDADKIFQGIRDVWASPYTERSFKWRQHYLNNPENVFPSIVIIPSVDADYSGVMITKGLTSDRDGDITVAFNWGVGGAVDGQAAESWWLHADGTNQLISPAREATYTKIPATGGSTKGQATFERRILKPENLQALRTLAARVVQELPRAPGISTDGPFDMELGFKENKMWLFQVRPFVENKQAAASAYLQHITPAFNGGKKVSLDLKI